MGFLANNRPGRGQDVDAGRVEVDQGPEVGEGGRLVVLVDGGHRAHGRLRGRRDLGGVSLVVAGGHGHEDVGVDQGPDGLVDHRRSGRGQGDVDHDALGALVRSPRGVFEDKLQRAS